MYLNGMAKRMLRLQLPEPCDEDWDEMKPTGCGRFCAQCDKTVIDFTRADDATIARFFANKPLQICGRFRDDQLNQAIPFPETKAQNRIRQQLARIAASLIMLQSTAPSLQAQEVQQQIVLSGNITDYLSRQPLVGMEITITGVNYPKYSDRDGNFSFVLPTAYAGQTVTVQAAYQPTATQEAPGFKIREEQVLISNQNTMVQLQRYPCATLKKIDITVPYGPFRTGKITYYEGNDRKDSDLSKRINTVQGTSLLHKLKAVFKKK